MLPRNIGSIIKSTGKRKAVSIKHESDDDVEEIRRSEKHPTKSTTNMVRHAARPPPNPNPL